MDRRRNMCSEYYLSDDCIGMNQLISLLALFGVFWQSRSFPGKF
jgi:hypothetical protein